MCCYLLLLVDHHYTPEKLHTPEKTAQHTAEDAVKQVMKWMRANSHRKRGSPVKCSTSVGLALEKRLTHKK